MLNMPFLTLTNLKLFVEWKGGGKKIFLGKNAPMPSCGATTDPKYRCGRLNRTETVLSHFHFFFFFFDFFMQPYLIQLSGSFLQSVLHLNRSHDNHPIGGVSAKPLSSACTVRYMQVNASSRNFHFIFLEGIWDRNKRNSVVLISSVSKGSDSHSLQLAVLIVHVSSPSRSWVCENCIYYEGANCSN